MKISTRSTPQGVAVDIDWDAASARRCGGCVLCCKLLPNAEFGKPAGKPCRAQRSGKGCAIYAHRPMECSTWSCRWLAATEETAGMARPDRAHYCIDPLFDEIRLVPPDGGEPITMSVLQVWIDPAFPQAKDDPALRAYLARMAEEHHVAAILRWSTRDATVLFAPSLNADGTWHEQTTNLTISPEIGLFKQLPAAVQRRLR